MTQFNSNDEQKKQTHWRSIEDLEQSPEFLSKLQREFPHGASELEMRPGVHRRKFLGIIGASLALAGVTSTGCIRRPKEHVYPESHRPEDTLPGVPKNFATSAQIAGSVLGLLVTSTDGRPTKIDGNSRHISSNPIVGSKIGSSNAFAQAEILNMYDPDRGQKALKSGKEAARDNILNDLKASLLKSQKSGGEDLALIYSTNSSPSYSSLIEEFKLKYPKAIVVEQDSNYSKNRKLGLSQVLNSSVDVTYDFLNANVILAVDSDFMGIEGDSVKNARQFAEKRKILNSNSSMNRLYSVESHFSITGTASDHRYTLRSGKLGEFLVSLASELSMLGAHFPTEISKYFENKFDLADGLNKWIKACAKDLYSQRNASLVIVGDRQPAWMHALGFAINSALGAAGKTVTLTADTSKVKNNSSIANLKAAIESKSTQTIIIIDGNPVYSLPADAKFSELLPKVKNSFYLGFGHDETSAACSYFIPKTHFLESWGDARTADGTVGVRQPLIAPLFDDCLDEYSFISFLIHLDNKISGYTYVKQYWQKKLGNPSGFENIWRHSLSNGFISEIKKEIISSNNYSYAQFANDYSKSIRTEDPSEKSIDLEFYLDRTVYDGSYSNNAWMQELPDPVHKLVWDNALLLSPKTARAMGLRARPKPGKSEVDLVRVTYRNRSFDVAVWEVPGVADFTGVLQLGYGRKAGRVAKDCGFNANLIRTSDSWYGSGAKLEKTGQKYSLVSTQEHGSMNGTPGELSDRPQAVREATLKEYKSNPEFVLEQELIPIEEQRNNLFKFPKDPAQKKWARQQWGMTIDLNTCIGCNACTVACQSENNISVVGKEEVFKNREMSWIRLDRYFTGNVDDPEVRTVFQPMNCQHCENAPCEAVCPVAATVHSPDGLNDMAYNRCVGTRYCANNCPYKVRRYNFFNYSKIDDERNPLYAMQKNPNVTVRFRGVMEKCTYCVQKINSARSKFKKTNDGLIPDGAIVTACQSVCPTNAIVFGDIADPSTAVSKLKEQSRNYAVLGELNVKPRTTYLAKLRNANPDLG
ncbi:TAT-variant-translocated molybdopterin oxidoreductase [Fluviispira multicolorata]|uniref:4Fe-4S dicluster domain-containing protein n=1 Tax=Fluviispira multicolorata TaxID=2654512 RepID=A0A833JDZ6_9BACT|nr:TAT-variant-translocated molybdopterin oxidoreductase [Fluviispira multicolorata]KAB8030992.1 4Fe-4S dicluster domain-containing protein [Fluviispira multicolorata]